MLEQHEVTAMARRIAAMLLLELELDASYHAVIEDVYPWPGSMEVQDGAPATT